MYADRYGVSSAVVVEDAVYLVDLGHGSQTRFVQAGIGSASLSNRPMEGLAGVFLTHLHSDHIAEYAALQLTGMWNGLDDPARPVHIHGPGDRGGLPPVFGARPEAPVLPGPGESPTPGTVEMTEHLHRAFATDLNDRIRSSGATDPAGILITHDIALPAGTPIPHDTNPMPPVAPFPVFEDDRVRVTATLVNHAPVFPSFGFRFDTEDGSITFSGDTAPSDNLVELARDTDYLVHEVIDEAWVESRFPEPHTPAIEALIDHLLGSHTTIEDVGPVADRVNAGTLVLNHLVPGDNPESRWLEAHQTSSRPVVVGRDLMQFGMGPRR
ncbi:MBL fold metallo-hydrolase [Geodermatophilus sp. CPCC 205506]|uniref:MBL fold metallo-hydrolase n=1 Tax=Geodermatophilus sp. CPCC 205506 TaxID=2936596 RepID=UPI003EEF34B2